MGMFKDKARGFFNKATGRMKQGVGNIGANDQIRSEGRVQEVKGTGYETLGEAKGKASDVMNQAAQKLRRTG